MPTFTGDIISDVIPRGGSADYDIRPFRWTRFREGDLLSASAPTTPSTIPSWRPSCGSAR